MDNFENNLKNIKIKPDKEWQAKTRANIEKFADFNVTNEETSRKEIRRQNIFKLFFTNFDMNRKALLAGGTFAFVLLAVVGTFVGYNLWTSYNKAKSVPITLSEAEKQQIYEGILKNNSTATLNQRSATEQLTANSLSANAEDAKLAAGSSNYVSTSPLIPDYNQYNFRSTTSTTTVGPAAQQCKSLAFNFESPSGDRVTKWVNVEFNNNGENYYESSSYDDLGNLYRYNLSKNNSTQSEYYDYAGGSFAVKNVYIYPQATGAQATEMSAPEIAADGVAQDNTTPTASDIEQYIKDYFGPDTDIVEAVELGGKKYYVLQYSYDIDCNQAYYSPMISSRIATEFTPTNKAVIRNWVDSENFNIVKTLNYIDSVEDNKLVYTNETTLDQRNVQFSEVSSTFDFDYPSVEVREFVTQGQSYEYSIENEINNTINGIKTNSIPVLNLNRAGLQLSYVYFYDKTLYSSSQGYDYIYERNFYPSDARGQKIYDDAVKVLNDSKQYEYAINLLSLSFGTADINSTVYEYYGLNAYEKSEGLDKILNSVRPSGDQSNITSETKQIDLMIDGKAVSADYYSYRVDQQAYTVKGIEPAIDSTSLIAPAPGEGASYVYYTRFAVFESGNYIYVLTLPGDEAYTLPELSFTELNPTIADEMESIKSLVRETLTRNMNPIQVDPGIGNGSNGSDVACTMDAKICDDGSSVGRDPLNNCEFYACPVQ